jgi:LytS/YehU family sensor histidine kinase
MEEYGNFSFCNACFLILIIIENYTGITKEDTAPNMDAVSSVSSGMVNFKRCWD